MSQWNGTYRHVQGPFSTVRMQEASKVGGHTHRRYMGIKKNQTNNNTYRRKQGKVNVGNVQDKERTEHKGTDKKGTRHNAVTTVQAGNQTARQVMASNQSFPGFLF